jgi:hypothetical protein
MTPKNNIRPSSSASAGDSSEARPRESASHLAHTEVDTRLLQGRNSRL